MENLILKEEVLHFIWKFGLSNKALYTSDGEFVEVISTGQHNLDAGPDFQGSKVRIGNTLWVGNVEIHIKSSDWHAHSHDKDQSYNNIILHVVYKHNREIYRKEGTRITTLELKNYIDEKFIDNYATLLRKEMLSCRNILPEFLPVIKYGWLEKLAISRFELKCKDIEEELDYTGNNWEKTFFTILCKCFGLKVNSVAFEHLSRLVSLNTLAKHKDKHFQIEALFFGQAGLLEEDKECDYYKRLKKEYQFLRSKYDLKEINKHEWKFMRMRPQSFPTIRLAFMSNLVYRSTHMFRKCMNVATADELVQLLDCEASEYWNTHYSFDKASKKKKKSLGIATRYIIIINGILPVMFLYGKKKAIPEFCEKAINLMQELPAEKNRIVNMYKDIDVKAYNALHSQALLHLYKEYCTKKKCLECQFGLQTLIS
ncbi:MAG: DUF2851 family protein [Hyphomicrobiales bacterium]